MDRRGTTLLLEEKDPSLPPDVPFFRCHPSPLIRCKKLHLLPLDQGRRGLQFNLNDDEVYSASTTSQRVPFICSMNGNLFNAT